MATYGGPGTPDEHARALVLHDSQAVVALVTRTLNNGLFEVRGVRTVHEAEALLAAWHAHIAVVDIDHDHAVNLLKLLGASNTMTTSATPVLALARRSDLPTKLRAFDLGADDIVAMPFAPEELLARAKVIARRASGTSHHIVPTIRLNECEIDIEGGEVRQPGRAVALTRIEQDLLRVLAANAGRIVTRDEILNAVWGIDHVPESNVVDRHVRDVRSKLADDHHRPKFIQTVAGEGYRFLPVYANGTREARPGDDLSAAMLVTDGRNGPRGAPERSTDARRRGPASRRACAEVELGHGRDLNAHRVHSR
jgi:DNA-binding response OmpR family regulator